MKSLNFAAVLILGLTTPLLTQTLMPNIAVAQANSPNGIFADRDWTITISYENNTYRYSGVNNRTKNSIELSGASVSGDRQRRYYLWNNDGTRYRVTWNRQNPDYIRIQVKTPSGKEILNRVIPRSREGDL
jgi:hypothetical protein